MANANGGVTLRLSTVDDGSTQRAFGGAGAQAKTLNDNLKSTQQTATAAGAALNNTAAAADKTASATNNAGAAMQQASAHARALESSTRGAGDALGFVGTALKAIIGGEAIKTLADMSDGWANVNARVALVAGSASAARAATAALFDISQQTQTSLTDNASLYTRIGQALVASGNSQAQASQRALDAVLALDSALKLTGANQSQVNSTVLEFTEAINEGYLQGRQFNQLYKEVPGLMNGIRDALGVTGEQFKKMAANGQLSAELILTALSQASTKLEQQAAGMPVTIARAFTVLTNAVEQFVGTESQASGAAAAISGVLVGLAHNLNTVAEGFLALGAVNIVSKLSAGMTAIAAAVTSAIAPEAAFAAAQARSAEAALAAATAQGVRQESILAQLEATQAAVLAETRLAQAEVAEANAATVRAAAAVKLNALLVQQAELDTAVMAADTRLAAARGAVATETAALAVAQASANATLTAGSVAAGGLAAAGRGILALFGGWPGIVIAAIAATGYALYEASQSGAQFEKQVRDATSALDEFAKAPTWQGLKDPNLQKAVQTFNDLQREAVQLRTEIAAGEQSFGNFGEAGLLAATDLAATRQRLEDVELQLDKLNPKFNDAAIGLANLARAAIGLAPVAPSLSLLQARVQGLTPEIEKQTAALEKQAATWGLGAVGMAQYEKGQALNLIAVAKGTPAYATLAAAVDSLYAPYIKTAQAADAHKAAIEAARKAQEEAQSATRNWQQDLTNVANVEEQLSDNLAGPYKANQDAYNAQIKVLEKAFKDAAASGNLTWDMVVRLSNAEQKAGDRLKQNNATTKERLDLQGKLLRGLDDEIEVLGKSVDEQQAYKAVQTAVNQAMQQGTDLRGKEYATRQDEIDAINEQIPALQAEVQARQNVIAALKYQQAESEAFRQIELSGISDISNAFGQFATGQIKGFHDLWKTLIGDARNFVAQMIATYLRLEVIQPLVANLLGWGPSQGGGMGGGIAGLAMQAGSAALVGSSAQTSAVSGGMQSPGAMSYFGGAGQLGSAYSTLGGVGSQVMQYGPGALWSGVPGSTGSSILGGPSYYTDANGFMQGTAYAPSTFGNVVGIAGAGLAAYGEYKNAGGGAAGVVGGAAYGLGTLTATGAIGGVLAGSGAAAGAAGSLGAVGLGAIPIVGWIALAAMALNMITGGGLFGTGWKVTGATTSVDIGAGGGTASEQLQESRKKPLFQGRAFKGVSVDAPKELDDAAQKVFESITSTVKKASAQLAIDVPSIVTGSFQSFYDKKGKLTKEQSTILGVVYTETFEDFTKRITAENVVNVAETAAAAMADAAPDTKARLEAIVGTWRSSADELLAGAQVMLAAQEAIQKGNSLIEGDTSLADVLDEVVKNQEGNETLADTYARLFQASTDLRTALTEMGVNIGKTGTDFVDFAAQIADAAGGVQQAEALWNSFFSSYYTQTEQLAAQVTLTKKASDQALTAVGESTTVTMAQFRKDFENAMPSLTPDEVVKWLQAGQALGAFTAATNQYEQAARQATQTQIQAAAGADPFLAALQNITNNVNAATKATEGQAGAEAEIGYIHFQAAQQVKAAIAILKGETQDLIASLYGGVGGSLSEVNQQIDQLTSSTGTFGGGLSDVQDQLGQTFEQWQQGLKGVQDFLQGLLTNTQLTTLTPQQQLAAAQAAYQTTLAKAQGGDATALQALPQLAQTFLQQARGYYSSGDAYQSIFDALQKDLGGLPQTNGTAPGSTGGGGGGTVSITVSSQLQALFDKRAELEAQQTVQNRLQLAVDLAQHLRDLAAAVNKPVLQLTADMGVKLQDLAKDVGVDLKNLDENSVQAMAGLAAELGTNLATLTTGLGLNLTDLAGGIEQLAADMGINLSSITTTTTEQLAVLAANLGTNLDTLATSLGIDLGTLTDKQSLLNQGLGDTIDTLPEGDRDALKPLFDAITNATTEADANAAIAALEDAVTALPSQERNELAPYFDDLAPSPNDPSVDELKTANDWLGQILDELVAVNASIEGVPAHAQGSANIERTGLATIHAGEMVIDPQSANVLRKYGISVSSDATPRGGDSTAVVDQLKGLRDDLEDYHGAQIAQQSKVAQNLDAFARAGQETAKAAQQAVQKAQFQRG
jgi:tape measure domain-containing protein